jgi:predicted nucleic acid-binding protein
MTVVADTSPLNYLVLIDAFAVLPSLYPRVIVPRTVAVELAHLRTPESVRRWIERPPEWLEIVPDPATDEALNHLDPGERTAIALAVSLRAQRLLIDDYAGRVEAERRGLKVTGTLGVLAAAHRATLLDFELAAARLGTTTFYLSPRLLATTRRLLRTAGES